MFKILNDNKYVHATESFSGMPKSLFHKCKLQQIHSVLQLIENSHYFRLTSPFQTHTSLSLSGFVSSLSHIFGRSDTHFIFGAFLLLLLLIFFTLNNVMEITCVLLAQWTQTKRLLYPDIQTGSFLITMLIIIRQMDVDIRV